MPSPLCSWASLCTDHGQRASGLSRSAREIADFRLGALESAARHRTPDRVRRLLRRPRPPHDLLPQRILKMTRRGIPLSHVQLHVVAPLCCWFRNAHSRGARHSLASVSIAQLPFSFLCSSPFSIAIRWLPLFVVRRQCEMNSAWAQPEIVRGWVR
jgi:hypothetical protein